MFAFMAVTVVATFVVCDLVLTLAASASPRLQYYLSPPWARAVVPDPRLGVRMSPFYPGHDARGFRNESVPEKADVVAVGDSLTYGFAAPPEQSWPRQLSGLSGARVYNAGVGGYGPFEYELVLENLADLRASTVLVGLYLGNDVANAYASVYIDDRFPSSRTSDSSAAAAFADANTRTAWPDAGERFSLGRSTRGQTGGPMNWIARHSSLYGVGRSLMTAMRGGVQQSAFREVSDPRDTFETASKRPRRVGYDEVPGRRTVFRDPRLDTLAVDLDDPRIAEGKRLTEAVLQRMHAKVRQQGARLVVVLLPNKPAVYAKLFETAQPDMATEFLRLGELEARVRQELRGFLTREGIEHVDVLPALQQALATGSSALFPESDDHHPNAAGYGVIAGAIHSVLSSSHRGE